MRLRDFRAFSFDCYGTLIDWESGLASALQPLLRKRPELSIDQALAAFAQLETRQQANSPAMPYPDILARVYNQLAVQWDLTSAPGESERFGQSIGNWPAFEDTAESLRILKQHAKIFILSNVNRASFALSNARLGVTFDGIFTAEDIGAYKPAVKNFEFMLSRVGEQGIARHELLHVAQSLYHDHAPANRLGIASAWIDRRGRPGGATATAPAGIAYTFRFPSLSKLAEALINDGGSGGAGTAHPALPSVGLS
jgi:2-haloalkanoic acid dehalogenase type II